MGIEPSVNRCLKCNSDTFILREDQKIECSKCSEKMDGAQWDSDYFATIRSYQRVKKCIENNQWFSGHSLDCDCTECEYWQPQSTLDDVRKGLSPMDSLMKNKRVSEQRRGVSLA